MSLYSGKCDLYDHFMMIGVDENTTEEDIEKEIQKTDFYIRTKDGKRHRLMINSIHDLVPYSPYLVGIDSFSKEHSYIELSQRSFVDSEEDEIMSWKMNDLKKMWRKCKRLGIEFNFDYVKEKQGDYLTTDPNYKRLVELIMDKGDKTELNDIYAANIHSRISEYYRNKLYETMISYGYSKEEAYCWCFNEFLAGNMERVKKMNDNNFDFCEFFYGVINNPKYNTEMTEHKKALDKLYKEYTNRLEYVKKNYKVLRNDNGEHKIMRK